MKNTTKTTDTPIDGYLAVSGSALISEFMQIKEIESSHESYGQQEPFWYSKYLGYRTPAFSVVGKSVEYLLNENKFNNSWDWLMPVVEKIESMGFWTKIGGHTSFGKQYKQCCIKKQAKDSDSGYVYEYEGDWCESKIESTFIAVVEFIKWHNSVNEAIS